MCYNIFVGDFMKLNKLFIILVPVLCILAVVVAHFKIVNTISDSVKFKEEYESLNGEESSSGETYKEINIDKNNPIKYTDYEELIDVIENKTGVIYLGFPECPWCRSALPVLLDAAKENNINTIYYLNLKNERDSYVVEDGKLVYALDDEGNEIKGTEGYFELLDALDEYLSDYTIVFEDETYEVGEKRIYAPSVIFVKDGEVIGIHVSTIETQENAYEELSDDQYEELYSIYEDYMLELNNTTCSLDSSC